MAADTQPSPDTVFELFNVYAKWDANGTRGGLTWDSVKLLLCELDVFEGAPRALVDVYVREVMLRADADQDGQLSCQEFMVWIHSELCALLPFRALGAPHAPVAPLYNRWLYLCQRYRPPGAYRKVPGMTQAAFMEMCQDLGWFADPKLQRRGIQLAVQAAVASRVQGNMEGGTRLQFAAFMLALRQVAARKQCGWDSILHQVMGDGSPPPALLSHGSNTAYRQAILKLVLPCLMESPREAPLRWTSRMCAVCGKEHSLWVGVDTVVREALRNSHAPNLQFINTRNVRAAFHRYCLRFNKGLKPPSSGSDTDTTSLQHETRAGADGRDQASAQQNDDPWGADGFPACACNYKQLSSMELQTFWRVVMDNQTLWHALQPSSRSPVLTPPSDAQPKELFEPLVPERIEAAFMAACSMAGVYCDDRGMGIHDKALGRAASPSKHNSCSTPLGSQPTRAYGTPFNSRAIRSSTHRTPNAAPAGAPASPGGHRQPVPRLTFTQFLEAMRLVAEDMKGHPHDLPLVEHNLACILHDLVLPGCPLAHSKSFAWTLTGRSGPPKLVRTGTPIESAVAESSLRRGQAVSPAGGVRGWR